MSIIGARGDDWRPGRPDVHPAWWIVGIICAFVFYLVVAGIIGSVVNGSGSPVLASLT